MLPGSELFLREKRLVAAEQLIAAIARQHDFHMLAGQFRDEVCRKIEKSPIGSSMKCIRCSNSSQRVWSNDLDVMVDAEVIGDTPGPLGLVVAGIVKANAESLSFTIAATTVELSTPPERNAPERHVAHELSSHCVADHFVGRIFPFGIGVCGGRCVPLGRADSRNDEGSTLPVSRSISSVRAGSRRRISRSRVCAPGTYSQERNWARESTFNLRAARALKQGAALISGAKDQLISGQRVIERLDTNMVAHQHEPAPGAIEERNRKHAIETAREVDSLLAPTGGQPPPCRRRSRSGVPWIRALCAALAVVVDLAVEDDRDSTVFVEDRLMSANQVDDRKAPHAQRNRSVD